jgi:hypothetical protein
LRGFVTLGLPSLAYTLTGRFRKTAENAEAEGLPDESPDEIKPT